MNNLFVRISGIKLTNFKNVENGEIVITDDSKLDKASILGIYGQNGSGKTAIIDALKILQSVLSDGGLENRFAEYISLNSESSQLDFTFILEDKDNSRVIDIDYSFQIEKANDNLDIQTYNDGHQKVHKIKIVNETLKFSMTSQDLKIKKQELIITEGDKILIPKTKLEILTDKNKDALLNLLVAKKIASSTARSFIFCKESLETIHTYCKEKLFVLILDALSNFGKLHLFVIDTTHTVLNSPNALVFNFNILGANNEQQLGQILVPLGNNAIILEEAFFVVEKIIENMNIVLGKLIPGLTIKIINNGNIIIGKGQKGCRVQLLSHKNGNDIPLRYESEGTKKIVAVLQLLINMYSNPSTTVVIDELDAGVFEYLLGQLLEIISEKGKGQLIFTSHNLRPLETLDKSFIAFTTINPQNRYIRMQNVKTNNNLRNLYFNNNGGEGQEEKLFNKSKAEDIINAFEEASNMSY